MEYSNFWTYSLCPYDGVQPFLVKFDIFFFFLRISRLMSQTFECLAKVAVEIFVDLLVNIGDTLLRGEDKFGITGRML